MTAIRVDLTFNEETGKWDWSANLGGDNRVAGSGFDTAQDAVTGASQAEGIKGERFYAQADKAALFRERQAEAPVETGASDEETPES